MRSGVRTHDPVILTVGGLMVTIIAVALYVSREWAMVLIWALAYHMGWVG